MTTPKEILNKYAEIKLKIKRLEAEVEFLQPEVTKIAREKLEDLDEKAVLDVEGLGTISLVRRKQWKYSPDVTGLEEEVKERKKEEQQTGKATYNESIGVMFKEIGLINRES